MLRVRRQRLPEVQIPLAALIDIVFLLLIYFLLTTNFLAQQGIKVQLPKARAAAAPMKNPATIFINEAGEFFWEGRSVTEAELLSLLKEALKQDPEKTVIIKADRRVILDEAVRAMDLAKAAGGKRLLLATQSPQQP
ncbi:ExbD/TolR family protein [Thermosulfuriphilus sp.]